MQRIELPTNFSKRKKKTQCSWCCIRCSDNIFYTLSFFILVAGVAIFFVNVENNPSVTNCNIGTEDMLKYTCHDSNNSTGAGNMPFFPWDFDNESSFAPWTQTTFKCCEFNSEYQDASLNGMQFILMFITSVLNPILLFIDWRVGLFAGLPHGYYVMNRTTLDGLFGIYFWFVFFLERYASVSCFRYGLGAVTHFLAVASEIFNYIMFWDLWLQSRKFKKIARWVRKYTTGLVVFLATLSSITILNIFAIGKSSPTTCWILNVDESINLITLVTLAGPLIIFGLIHAFLLIKNVSTLIKYLPNSQDRVSLERQLSDCRFSWVLLFSAIILSVLLIAVVPYVGFSYYSNYINASWPVWFCFYIGVKSTLNFIKQIEWKNIVSAFSFKCCIKRNTMGRKSKLTASEGVFQLEDSDNEDSETGGLIKIESSNSIMIAQIAQCDLLQQLVTDDWKIEFHALKLGRKIAAGACGQVYKGFYYNTPVAIKELFSPRWDPLDLSDFKHELLMLSRLHHPNIVMFLGACLELPHLYLVTEWVSRGSLEVVMKDDSVNLSWPLIIRIATQIAHGLQYLHTKRIVHRDVKPHNILLDAQFTVKIADFGLSRVIEIGKTMTKNLGTPSWMAPEIIKGESLTSRECSAAADVYSFAIVLWQLKERKDPHDGWAPIDILSAVQMNDHRPDINSDWTPEFALLLKDCWARDPLDRPDFTEIIERLKNLPYEHSLSNYTLVSMDF